MFRISVPGITFDVDECLWFLLLKQTQILLKFLVAGYSANKIHYASTVRMSLHGLQGNNVKKIFIL